MYGEQESKCSVQWPAWFSGCGSYGGMQCWRVKSNVLPAMVQNSEWCGELSAEVHSQAICGPNAMQQNSVQCSQPDGYGAGQGKAGQAPSLSSMVLLQFPDCHAVQLGAVGSPNSMRVLVDPRSTLKEVVDVLEL